MQFDPRDPRYWGMPPYIGEGFTAAPVPPSMQLPAPAGMQKALDQTMFAPTYQQAMTPYAQQIHPRYCPPPQSWPQAYQQQGHQESTEDMIRRVVAQAVASAGPALLNNTGVRPMEDGELAASMPTRWSDQDVGLGSTAVAGAATVAIQTTAAKRGKVTRLQLSVINPAAPGVPFIGGILILSITAAGETLLASAAGVPAERYAQVDSFGNLSSPLLAPNTPLVVTVLNLTAATALQVTGSFGYRVLS